MTPIITVNWISAPIVNLKFYVTMSCIFLVVIFLFFFFQDPAGKVIANSSGSGSTQPCFHFISLFSTLPAGLFDLFVLLQGDGGGPLAVVNDAGHFQLVYLISLFSCRVMVVVFCQWSMTRVTSSWFMLSLCAQGDGGGPLAVVNDAGHFQLVYVVSFFSCRVMVLMIYSRPY